MRRVLKKLFNKKKKNNFPSQIGITAAHASFAVPNKFKKRLDPQLLGLNERLLRNFSDFGTKEIVELIPENQKIVASYWRGLGDPNRAATDPDFFPKEDFNGFKVWKKNKGLYDKEKTTLKKEFYDPFHKQVQAMLTELQSKHKRVLLLDIHDTGKSLLGCCGPEYDRPREKEFPPFLISDKEGRACSPDILMGLKCALEQETGHPVEINTFYQGGYITDYYGNEFNKDLDPGQKWHRNVLQLEIGRYLYMDESAQKINKAKLKKLRTQIMRALQRLETIV